MPIREVIDDDGRTWTIFEVVPGSYDDRIGVAEGYTRGWICFQSETEKRRHLGIPPRWEALEDLALLDLMRFTISASARDAWGRKVAAPGAPRSGNDGAR